MSIKMKLVSLISLFILVLGLVVIGVLAASQQTLTMTGSVNFNVADRSLWVKQVRIKQDNGTDPVPVTEFLPGYINGENGFNMNIGDFTGENSNTLGSFSLYFDIINTTDIQWAISNVTLSSELQSQGVTASYSGVISAGTLTSSDQITQDTELSGTLILTISAPNLSAGDAIDLSGITITIEEYVEPDLQVTSVFSTGATTNTYDALTGEKFLNDSIDLSDITFNTGETTLTISMTSLSVNYIKNIVSWYDTPNITISSTSLYLPQNPSEQLTSGTSRDLTITVNNTGSATTISGLEVEFEEKTDLLQVTEEGETSTYTDEGYWYVEMGTYSTTTDNAEGKRESEYLRWRYFSDTTSHYEFDRNTRPTGDGYFILESYYSSYNNTDVGGLYCSWNNDYTYRSDTDATHNYNGWNNIDANDYSTSNIRQYINGNDVQKSFSGSWNTTVTPNGTSSNMFTDLHIDPDNDIIYTDIIGRTLGDLYTDMSNSGTNPQDVDFPKGSPDDWTGATITYSKEDTDKFWLLSYYEAYHMLGADTSSSTTDREWGSTYWLRSPYSSNSNNAYRVYMLGSLTYVNVNTYKYAVRAAFKFPI